MAGMIDTNPFGGRRMGPALNTMFTSMDVGVTCGRRRRVREGRYSLVVANLWVYSSLLFPLLSRCAAAALCLTTPDSLSGRFLTSPLWCRDAWLSCAQVCAAATTRASVWRRPSPWTTTAAQAWM